MAYQLQGAVFDGSNDWGLLSSLLAGAVASPTTIYAIWVRPSQVAAEARIDHLDSNRFHAYLAAGGNFTLRLANSANTTIWQPAVAIPADQWSHLLFLRSGLQGDVWLDGVRQNVAPPSRADNCAFNNGAAWGVGTRGWGAPAFLWQGSLADTLLDITTVPEIADSYAAKFIQSNGRPIDYGADGSGPTGSVPIIWRTRRDIETPDAYMQNRGSAQDFTLFGALDEDDVDARPPASETYAGPWLTAPASATYGGSTSSWSTPAYAPAAGGDAKLLVSLCYMQTSPRELVSVQYGGADLALVGKTSISHSGSPIGIETWFLDDPLAIVASAPIDFVLSGGAFQQVAIMRTLIGARPGLPEPGEIELIAGYGHPIQTIVELAQDHSLVDGVFGLRGTSITMAPAEPGQIEHEQRAVSNNHMILTAQENPAGQSWRQTITANSGNTQWGIAVGWRAPAAAVVPAHPASSRAAARSAGTGSKAAIAAGISRAAARTIDQIEKRAIAGALSRTATRSSGAGVKVAIAGAASRAAARSRALGQELLGLAARSRAAARSIAAGRKATSSWSLSRAAVRGLVGAIKRVAGGARSRAAARSRALTELPPAIEPRELHAAIGRHLVERRAAGGGGDLRAVIGRHLVERRAAGGGGELRARGVFRPGRRPRLLP